MLLHYLKITFRNIAKNKFQYLLTTLGIAVGMAIFSIMFFFADGFNGKWDEKLVDRNLYTFVASYYNKNGEVAHVTTQVENTQVKKILHQPLPEIESIGIVGGRNTSNYICVENKTDFLYQIQSRGANKEFFELAKIEFIKGGINDTWDIQKSAVLTEKYAKKLFGNMNAIGQWIDMYNSENQLINQFTISGIIKKSYDIDFSSEMYFSLNIDDDRYLQTIVQLKKGTKLDQINSSLQLIGSEIVNNDSDISGSQKFLEIKPFNKQKGSIPVAFYIGMLVMGGLVLAVALLNFANLLIASMQVRIRQFTLRKIVGAGRRAFLLMVLCEILPILLSATFLCYLILEILLNWYKSHLFIPQEVRNEIDTFLPLMFKYPIKIAFWTLLVCMGLAVLLVQRIQKIVLVQGIRGQFFKLNRNIGRNILLFFQLLITLVFLQLSIFIFFTTRNSLPDFYQSLSKEQSEAVLIVPLHQLKLSVSNIEIMNRIKSLPGVLQITSQYSPPTNKSHYPIFLHEEAYIDADIMTQFEGYNTFWEINDPQFKRNLAPGEAIINRTFAERLKRDSLTTFYFPNQEYKVVGIVEQIPYTDYKRNVILVSLNVSDSKLCTVKCAPALVKETKKEIMKIIREYLPATVDYHINNLYDEISLRSRIMKTALAALGIAALFSLIITMLGVYTAVSYDVKRKRKEIAIRKINGATRKDIIRQFAKLYAVLLILSGLLSVLLYRFIMINLFKNSVTKYPFNTLSEVVIWLLLVLVVTLTIFTQIQKAVSENPADVIKSG